MPTLYPHALPAMLRIKDVATYMNVCTRIAYQIVKREGFPLVILTNKSWRIPRDAFFAWLEDQPGTKELIAARTARGKQDAQ
jgi:Helix-turn-helix domain